MTEAHALLWQNGTMTDLGNLGGTGAFAGNQSCAANNLGQAVGNSDLKGDTTTRAFLWQKGVMKDLGLLPGDVASLAFNINDRGEIVGIDLDADFNLRAILWENGVPYDLNTLVRGKTGLYLQLAESINAEGVIAGFGQTATGETHGFVATPIPNSAAAVESISTTEQAVTMPLAVSERARRLLLRHVPTGRLAARLRDMR
jgi:probable HAF family extracellular repeat protein